MTRALRPAVFVDRDGTLISERAYLADPEGVVLIEGVTDALRQLREGGFAVVVVTNQSGIARGLYTLDDYHSVAARLERILREAGVGPDGTYFCPHYPVDTGVCGCRKPATGMHRRAAEELRIDLPASYCVGDKITDVQPALELGGRGVLVRTGYGSEVEARAPAGVRVVDDLAAAAGVILLGADGDGSAVGRPR